MTQPTTNRPTILVVDDSRLMRVAARKILKEDFEILEAEDGEVAWEKLQAAPDITLVMSDLSMPNLDGLGLLKKMRESSDARMRELPVIIVTGAEDDDGSKKTALSAGASDFITKPFESVQLLARAKAQVKQQRTQQALSTSQASNQQLEQLSHTDKLTGLANQRAFVSHMEEDLSYAIRHRSELAVLLIRVDKYKVMFLRRGKQAAEETLRQVAEVLKAGRRREDTVARIGMDTFGILLPSANPPGAKRVAQQLRAAIDQHAFCFDGEAVPVSVSMGISGGAISPGGNADALLAEANQALDSESNTPAAAPPQTTPGQASAVPSPSTPQVTDEPAPSAAGSTPEADGTPVESTADAGESTQSVMETVAARPEPLRAADVARALQTLSEGNCPAHDPDELVQAVVPLLELWDRTHDGIHGPMIERLKSALRTADETAPVAATAPDSTPETA